LIYSRAPLEKFDYFIGSYNPIKLYNKLVVMFTVHLRTRIRECIENKWHILDISDLYLSEITEKIPDHVTNLRCAHNNLKQLPLLPPNLTLLYCEDNQLLSLPSLPKTLVHLKCSRNNLTLLPSLPESLEALICDSNKLTELPTLPSGLISLECRSNNLTTLPDLPDTIETLSCSQNNIETLSILPEKLKKLYCWSCKINILPKRLPLDLHYFYCQNNMLRTLPDLPSGLVEFSCSNNLLVKIPILPDGIIRISIEGNRMTCLPELPNTLEQVSIQGVADKYLHIPKHVVDKYRIGWMSNYHLKETPNYSLIMQELKKLYWSRKRKKRMIFCEKLQDQIDEFRYRPTGSGCVEVKERNKGRFIDL
jgi:Leucine-rich repeat (LRR) protein